jgi:uncharacterized protein (TIGR00290 family)
MADNPIESSIHQGDTAIIPVVVAFSGGKDSTMALWRLPRGYQPVALLTNIQASTDRVSVHGVPRHLVEQQAAALGLPLHVVSLPNAPSNAQYEAAVGAALELFYAQGVRHIVYGDLLLEDIRAYRDAHLARIGWEAVYPLWGRDTRQLIDEFIDAGFKAVVTCVDTTRLATSFCGRVIDPAFLSALPATVDPCGENGEFHTFVYDGPLFAQAVSFQPADGCRCDERFCWFDLS